MYKIESSNSKKPKAREMLAKYGVSHLTDCDLIALLLRCGTKTKPVSKLSEDVLDTLRSTNAEERLDALKKIPGLGDCKASVICAAMELGHRYNSFTGKKIIKAKDLIPFVQAYSLQKQEHFICVTLNGGQEIINMRVISIGTINRTIVHPREIFSDALKERATAIIICHNHPSGNVFPSDNDIDMTQRLLAASEIIGIKILDHIIISATEYFSFAEHHMIEYENPELINMLSTLADD